MKCLNTYGCTNEAAPNSNFCSEKCRLIYEGKEKPDYSNYLPYTGDNKESKIIGNIFPNCIFAT